MAAKFFEIAKELRNFILSPHSISTYRLPTEQEMCEQYQVSRQTIRQALELLEEENLIIRIKGSGAYIQPHADYLRKVKIVLLVAEEDEYIYPELISDICSVLTDKSLHVTVRCSHNDVNTERRILKELLSEHISLLVAEGVHTALLNPNIDLYRALCTGNTEIMFIGTPYPELTHAGCVQRDDRQGGYLLGKQMILHGKQNVCAILPDYAADAKERFFGFLSAYREKNLPIPAQNVFWYSRLHIQELYQNNDTGFLSDFVKHLTPGCEGIFCYNDEIAYPLIKTLTRAKISVPAQISVVSFDNSPLCTLSNPAISSFSLPKHEPGHSIGTMISNYLFKKAYPPCITLPWEYIERDTL